MKKTWPLFLALSFLILIACNNNTNDNIPSDESIGVPSAPQITYSIVATYPHDTSIYTQGLEFYKGQLLQSAGQYGSSKLAHTDLTTGKIVKEVKLDSAQFGEGLTVLNDTIYQLTWQEHKVNVYSAKDFKKIKELSLNTDGWGLTNDGKNLIVTDGSSNLYFYEPSTFRLLRTQSVTDNGNPAVALNELEFINGFVYANQYTYPFIVKIDPNSGQVVGRFDFTELVNRVKAQSPYAQEFNGISYNQETKKVYVTGKYWPQLFEVKFDF